MDLGLRQKDLGQILGATVNTVTSWEVGRSTPALWFLPRIIQFLGYVPFDTTRDSWPLSDRLKAYRRVRGLSQKRLAAKLGVDPSTVLYWERGKSRPNNEHTERIEALLISGPQGSSTPR